MTGTYSTDTDSVGFPDSWLEVFVGVASASVIKGVSNVVDSSRTS